MAGSRASLSPAGAGAALAEFAAELFDAADAAETANTSSALIGGVGVQFDYASELLHAMQAPATALLEPADRPCEVRIQLLASDVCGPPPRPPWPADAYRPRDEIAGFGSEQLEVSFHLMTGTLMLWDADAGRGLWWTRSAEAIPSWERAMPLRNVLRWALRTHGRSLAHGAVIGRGERFALLAGGSGAGKSTLALAAALDPAWTYLGDDHCVIDPSTLHADPLTCFAKATPRTLELLPALRALPHPIPDTAEGKRIVEMPPQTGRAGAALTALAVPHVDTQQQAAKPLPEGAAMAALAPTTLLQFPGSRPRDRELLGSIVRGLPSWSLPSGPSLPATLDALAAVLDEAAA